MKRLHDRILGLHDYIIVRDDYYQVNRQYLEWCDALDFEGLFDRAVTAPPDEGLTLQLELIALHQGEFLAGFEVGTWGRAYYASCEVMFLQTAKIAAEKLMRMPLPGSSRSC